VIAQTYTDAAKSGVALKNRMGLQQLLQDVVSGVATYNAILVYDVSRWGRFQDTDESAHYEFLCKSAGIPVHYCAETFENDGTMPSLIMKALKRTMAGEYSRELGVKVLAGQKRLAENGFKQGGVPGYGLRRFLVSQDRQAKQALEFGERKSIASDRVILVPGPPHEVQIVREIYRLLIEEKKAVYSIARELNRRQIPHFFGSQWDHAAVQTVLTHLKYVGCNVHGRTSSRLHTRCIRVPRSQWTVVPDAFEPMIDAETFAKAQSILQSRTISKSNEDVLAALRILYLKEGRLTWEIIRNSPDVPSISTIRHRFGGLRAAYELLGYQDVYGAERWARYARLRALRASLLQRIVDLAPNAVKIESRSGSWRKLLRIRNGRLISVYVCPCLKVWKESVRWLLLPSVREGRSMALIARATPANDAFKDFFILPRIKGRQTHLLDRDNRLDQGVRFTDIAEFFSAIESVRHL
jgi:DNA invertase Pin-like site-specific DNA recombinase